MSESDLVSMKERKIKAIIDFVNARIVGTGQSPEASSDLRRELEAKPDDYINKAYELTKRPGNMPRLG